MKTSLTKQYKSLKEWQRIAIWIFIGSLILCLAINVCIDSYFGYVHGDVINRDECVQVGIDTYHQLNDLPIRQSFIYEYKGLFTFMFVAIGLGWIIHGVGFTVIGRMN